MDPRSPRWRRHLRQSRILRFVALLLAATGIAVGMNWTLQASTVHALLEESRDFTTLAREHVVPEWASFVQSAGAVTSPADVTALSQLAKAFGDHWSAALGRACRNLHDVAPLPWHSGMRAAREAILLNCVQWWKLADEARHDWRVLLNQGRRDAIDTSARASKLLFLRALPHPAPPGSEELMREVFPS